MSAMQQAGLEGDSGDEADLGAQAAQPASPANGLAAGAASGDAAEPAQPAQATQQPQAPPTFKEMGLDSDSDDYDFDPVSVQEASQPAAAAAAAPAAAAPAERRAQPSLASQQLQAAGLEDSDDEADLDRPETSAAAAAAGTAARDPFEDEFADATEDLGKPGETQRRPVGPEETFEFPLVERPTELLRVARFGGLIDVEPAAFDPEKFDVDDAVEFDTGSRVVRAPTLNRARWRFTDETDPATDALKRESNARLVRWDDGSLSLFLGAECLDVAEQPSAGRQTLLGVYHEQEAAVQAQGLVHSRLTFRPLSVKSALHQNALRAGSLRGGAAGGGAQDSVKASLVLQDFQRDHAEAAGREHEQLKLKEKQEKTARRRGGGLAALQRPRAPARANAEYLEASDEDEFDELGLDEATERDREQRLLQAKRGAQKRPGDDLAGAGPSRPAKSAKAQQILDDSDDDF